MTVILALYPNTRGLHYACIQLPTTLLDYGTANPLPFSTGRFMKRIERFIDFFRPAIVVLKGDPCKGKSEQLIKAVSALANTKGLPVHSYTRRQIREVFEVHEARTRHEISQKLITWIPDLAPHLPKPRKFWQPESHRIGIFDAVSLAITHDYLTP